MMIRDDFDETAKYKGLLVFFAMRPLSLALSPLRGEREGSLSSIGGEGRGEEVLT
jgi:hypothetical protein